MILYILEEATPADPTPGGLRHAAGFSKAAVVKWRSFVGVHLPVVYG